MSRLRLETRARFAIGRALAVTAVCCAAPGAWASGSAIAESGGSAAAYSAPEPGPALVGVDARGLPIACGTGLPRPPAARGAKLSVGSMGWETVPGVVRADGSETFALEVAVGFTAAAVRLTSVSPVIVAGPTPLELHDDGAGADRVAGDGVYSAGPLGFDPAAHVLPLTYLGDADSPAGLDVVAVGVVEATAQDGTVHAFLLPPEIGLLGADVALAQTRTIAEGLQVSSHLVNVRAAGRQTQRFLRFLGGDLPSLTSEIYAALPDVFDFLVFFSTYKVEQIPSTSSANFTAGVHSHVKADYEGTGVAVQDLTWLYGSAGKLRSVNVLDAYTRGVSSRNLVHELVHQWACFVDPALGICDGAHYKPRSSAGSLVGGFRWEENADGSFTADCSEGRNGARRAPPIDLYLAGLLDAAGVAPVRAYADALSVGEKCAGTPIAPDEITALVGAADVQARHGVRLPGPATAPRDFSVGFVAESVGRLLTPVEMTWYETLARWATAELPAGSPDPYLGLNWAPITRFFGPGVTWSGDVCFADTDGDGSCDAPACLRGDCNASGDLDAGDPLCTVLCVLGAAPPGSDCTCAADCNCGAGVEASDPLCGVLRLIGLYDAPCAEVP